MSDLNPQVINLFREQNHNSKKTHQNLPPIPDKIYFTIGEASDLCLVKPHVLRYWEQEFDQLKPNKRRGNRRYYQREDILLVRQIKNLLYDHGFTIEGARAKLSVDQKDSIKISNADTTELINDTIVKLKSLLSDLEQV